ncbi:hypothetical protein KIM372_16620 [Bombiscardovia nodaiensis]|uniref:Helix-turn-helix domain-containing protein n=1 Tax=Bombiscardovia nodaiensis TaxID=2932181 RepID=A0ABM8BA15_9BIFI|nr:hypothetical protein KIM372_16620 [Bombiscardovia nodaiensis]
MTMVLNGTEVSTVLVDQGVKNEVTNVLDRIGDKRSEMVLDVRGERIPLPEQVSALIMTILEDLRKGTKVSIEETPERLSASSAAQMMGVSRPTFIKLAKANNLSPINVGSQKRYLTSEVLVLRKKERRKKLDAFQALRDELRQFEDFDS